MLLQIMLFHSILWLSGIPLYIYTMSYFAFKYKFLISRSLLAFTHPFLYEAFSVEANDFLCQISLGGWRG